MTHKDINQTDTRIDEERHLQLSEALQGNMQIFDLKQLADMEAIYKEQCQKSVAEYKDWCRTYQNETDMLALLYGDIEGKRLRRQAEDSIGIYWTIRRDFRRWFERYLAKTNCYPYQNKSKF